MGEADQDRARFTQRRASVADAGAERPRQQRPCPLLTLRRPLELDDGQVLLAVEAVDDQLKAHTWIATSLGLEAGTTGVTWPPLLGLPARPLVGRCDASAGFMGRPAAQPDAGADAVDAPAGSSHDGVVGQGDDVGHGSPDVLRPCGRERNVRQALVGQRRTYWTPLVSRRPEVTTRSLGVKAPKPVEELCGPKVGGPLHLGHCFWDGYGFREGHS